MNIYQPITKRQERQLNKVQAPVRKFNLVKGLKRCFNDFNDYMGIETTGDKIFYHTYLWGTVSILVWVLKNYNNFLGL